MKIKNAEVEIHWFTETDAFPLFLILPMLMFTHIQGVQAEKKAQAVEAKAIEYGIIGKVLSESQIDDGGKITERKPNCGNSVTFHGVGISITIHCTKC